MRISTLHRTLMDRDIDAVERWLVAIAMDEGIRDGLTLHHRALEEAAVVMGMKTAPADERRVAQIISSVAVWWPAGFSALCNNAIWMCLALAVA